MQLNRLRPFALLLPLLCTLNVHAGWWPWGSEAAPACPATSEAAAVLRAHQEAVPRDLFMDWLESLRNQSPAQMKAANDQTLLDLACLPVGESRGRVVAIDEDLATRLVDSIARHPIVAETETRRFNKQPGVEIGFCFGRATYTHLMLLHLGVLKDSIKKVWAVGNLNSGDLVWQFHVATIVRGTTPGTWWVLDSYWGEPLELKDWVRQMSALDPGGQMRVTISEPEKFSMQIGAYDRVQMGLDVNAEQDWYAGYFQQLMRWFAAKPDVRALGLPTPSELRER
ncbi:MAG: hypothetical protein KF767_09325 [Bdellovibrionaceae bacterium]|nr:hypothetical protein [Pseudobdellovibrionaceae bacterium]